jgi:DNA helicase HerA-like ATPase
MRTTVSNMGPQLLSRLLQLNETQEGILNIVFRIADDRGLLLIDMKDLRSMLNYVAENAKQYTAEYGNITAQSVGAIQRALLTLENQGADKFFAEPSFDIYDLLQCEQGKGVMNVLAADKLMLQPKLYSTFLLWLLSELYAQLPEVGDMDLPRLVFFFDEAHMLFDETSKALVDKIEQVVRLIRSKGVGVYFVTQSPTDIPEEILGQLGNRVQHALRAFTPKDQKAVKTAAETFRANPEFKTADAIMELGTGEALVSFLDEKGAPSMVERAKILFPLSQIGAVTEGQRGQIINQSRLYGKYDKVVDRESAFEVLMAEAEAAMQEEQEAKTKKSGKGGGLLKGIMGAVVGAMVTSVTSSIGTEVSKKVTGKKSKTTAKDIAGKAVGSAARTATRQLTRSVLGTLLK